MTYYRHFKGGYYVLILESRDTETGEARMVYRSLPLGDGDDVVHDRPKTIFEELVEVHGDMVPRFALVTENPRDIEGMHRFWKLTAEQKEEHLTLAAYVEHLAAGTLTPGDGSAVYATATTVSDLDARFSANGHPKWATHVVWVPA